jgi:AcrR family transcriptional regulator
MARTVDPQRRTDLLDRIVDYVAENGLSELQLRPLAKAVGSSPRVLLYYFPRKNSWSKSSPP